MLSRLIAMTISISLLFTSSVAQIDSISVKVIPPFPDEHGFIGFAYSLLNALHIDSRPWTVRRLCPIKSGSDTNSTALEEAERIMRSYPFWADAKIRMDENSRKLDVAVQELWTTKLNLTLRYIADEFEWGMWLEEENFAGLGTYLSCGYAQYIERNWWETAMKLYGFPTRQWDLSGYYNRNGREWSTGGKFFKNANYIDSGNLFFAKIEAESISVQRYYSGAVLRDTMDIEKNFASAEYLIGGGGFFYGVAAAYLKKSVLAHRDSTSSNSAARWLPLMFRISYFSRKFFQTRNVDNFSRIEDIPTGISATISAGYDFKKNDGNISKKIPLYLELCGAAVFKNSYHYVGLKMEKKYDYEIESIKFRSFAPVDSSKIFRFGIGADVVWLQSDCGDRYFIADGRTGFRGFPAYYEVGYGDDPFVKLSAEVRIFPQFEIFTLRPGIALFADAGGTYWGKVAEDFHKNSSWMTDFGVSFRICSTRSSRGNVNRFEISYSPQTRTIGFTIDSGQALSFYRQFDLNPSTGD